MTDQSNTQAAPYGYCPECGEPGVTRERRPDGDDKCVNGHRYPSRNAHNAQPTPEPLPDHADHVPEIAARPEPTFAGIAGRKLDDLKAQGYVVDGYSIQHAETKQRGFITTGGFVGWWINMDHVQPTHEPVAEGRFLLCKSCVTEHTCKTAEQCSRSSCDHDPVAHRCRDLSDADMDQIAGWLGELERGDIGYHALCGKIIASFIEPVALQGRDAFEDWAGKRWLPLHRHELGGDSYALGDVELAWRAWQAARASLPAGGVVEPVAWRGRNSLGEVVTDWLEYQHQTAEGVKKLFADEGGTVEYAYAAPQPSETQGRRQMTCLASLPGGKRTDKWDSARVADYNAGWNDYRKAARSAIEKGNPPLPLDDQQVDAECLTITGHLLSRRERDRMVWRMAEAHHGIPASPQDGGEKA